MNIQFPPRKPDDTKKNTKSQPPPDDAMQPHEEHSPFERPPARPKPDRAPHVQRKQADPEMSTSTYLSFNRLQRPYARKQSRRESGLYLPVWSLAIMLLGVLIVSIGIVALIAGLGGRSAEEESEAIIRVITSVPIDSSAQQAISPPTTQPLIRTTPQPTPGTFALLGPTLEPVNITPTPEEITTGKKVVIVNVGATGLNIRDTAGVNNSTVLFIGDQGEVFDVLDGPLQADGFVWWQVRSANDPDKTGWAAGQYLEVSSQTP